MSFRLRPTRRLPAAAAACLIVAAAGESGPAPVATRELRVRASEAFAPAIAPALEAFTRQTGIRATLEVRDPDPADGSDVVVGEDSELTRVLEGGSADLASAVDLGTIPWVYVGPAGAPADLTAMVAGADRVAVLGGRLGRAAREALGARLPVERVKPSRDPAELRAARYALVPRSLAGPGEQRPAAVRPLMVVAAAVSGSTNGSGARAFLDFLKSARGRAAIAPWVSPLAAFGELGVTASASAADTGYAVAVVDWWLPQCTLDHNGYNDPSQVIGPPDAVSLGIKDQYRGIMSLGQGGYVAVDMGVTAVDGPGADVRVFQTTSSEPVTLYAAANAQGPFKLVGLRVPCGDRTGSGILSNHCDFDLYAAGLAEARYLKVEDGEIYPCLKGGTITEGADIDAVQVLNPKP